MVLRLKRVQRNGVRKNRKQKLVGRWEDTYLDTDLDQIHPRIERENSLIVLMVFKDLWESGRMSLE